jgi:hypothetical protein
MALSGAATVPVICHVPASVVGVAFSCATSSLLHAAIVRASAAMLNNLNVFIFLYF